MFRYVNSSNTIMRHFQTKHLAGTLCLVLCSFWGQISAEAQEIELLYSDRLPWIVKRETQVWTENLNALLRNSEARMIARETSQQASLLQDVILGETDGAWVRLNDSSFRMQWIGIIAAPDREGSSALLSATLWRLQSRFFVNEKIFQGLQPLAFVVMPPPMLRLQRPVQHLKDFQGQAVRCLSPMCVDFSQLLEIPTRQITDEKFSDSLQEREFVGYFQPPLNSGVPPSYLEEWKARTPYIVTDPILWPRDVYVLVVSQSMWESLSSGQRRAVTGQSGERFSEYLGALIDVADAGQRREEYPFLQEERLLWPVSDHQRLQQAAQDFRHSLIKETRHRVGEKQARRLSVVDRILNEGAARAR